MHNSFRSLLVLTALAIVLAACGTTGASNPQPTDTPSDAPSPSVAPSEAPESPAETPNASPEPVGVLTVAEGAVADGPGRPLTEVLAGDLSQPVFVIGTLFMDTDGQLWFADSVTDKSVPTFGDVRLSVTNYPTSGPTWDMADADITGLQEVNGVKFFEDTKLYGTISQ
jgi:predicted small lipoprotein YifL